MLIVRVVLRVLRISICFSYLKLLMQRSILLTDNILPYNHAVESANMAATEMGRASGLKSLQEDKVMTA